MKQCSPGTARTRLALLLAGLVRALASLKLAIVLLMSLAAVLACATLVEASRGREFAAWYVYGSRWFVTLLAALGVNVLAATLIRFPWRRRQGGFLVTHAGILVLLAGAIQTFQGAVDGQLTLREGQRTDRFLVTSRCVVNVAWSAGGRRLATEFAFAPGPVDWPESRTLDFGTADAMGLKVLRYYRHARERTAWIADAQDYDGPALQLQLSGPSGNAIAEEWLSANVFGGEAIVGPTRHELLPLSAASLAEDFLQPPEDCGRSGVLSVHYQGRMRRIAVDGNRGVRIELAADGAAVEIVDYLPDAKPTPQGGFVSVSDNPRNPVVELKVYLPGQGLPLRQLAFALRPLLNLDAVHGEICPVKFWYHHAGVKPVPGIRFVQTPDGKLYCRAEAGDAYGPPREVRQGDRIPLGGDFHVTVQQHLPQARQEVTFHSVAIATQPANLPEAAAQVELTVDGQRRTVWLQRGESPYSSQSILTRRGPVFLSLGYESQPLGFALELQEFQRRANPGGSGDAALGSTVRLIDPAAGLDQLREISLNQPLAHGRFRLYQSGFEAPAHGRAVSVLTAACDPGRRLKYAGSLMICVGILGMLWRPALASWKVPLPMGILALVILLTPADAALGGAAEAPVFQWDSWRYLPVQDGGRQKPLDSLARETLRILANEAGWADPDSGQWLDASTLYLVLLFEWQGWDQAAAPPASDGGRVATGYFQQHRPDRWDKAPLLRVDFLALREALGLSRQEACISPLALSQAKVKLPDAVAERPFVNWAEGLLRRRQQGLTAFEDKALELAVKFWTYQEHRMGKRLAIAPIQGSDEQEWISLADLLHSAWNEGSDPTGLMRQARQHFLAARAAFLRSDSADFNQASAAFLNVIERLGPQLGEYPASTKIRWEVAYNRFVPFRVAWIATALAFALLLLSLGTRWRPFRVAGYAALVSGVAAMLAGFGLRVALSGRAPVTNMYESVVYVAWGIAMLGMAFEWRYRRPFVLAVAAGLATVALIVADNCPAVLDASLRPLQPVLRSNFWLVTHVLTITLSYAALALAQGIGNLTLGYYLIGSDDRATIRSLTEFNYRALQVGVLLLAAGTILGAVWADYSWGRYWGWDPKEVWALVALLGYLALLHARFAGWLGDFGVAAWSVACFSLVLMAWYGVNFVLGAGLHSYGFGGGGVPYVLAALGLQGLFVAAAAVRYVASGAAAEAERAARQSLPRAD